MGYYCTVPQCTSLAGKTKNVKFHRFPRDQTMADKWNVILKRGKPYTKYSKVCSLHFTQSDYNVTTMGQWKTLSKDAIPSQNLPKLNPDGTVMVIRKSRTVKYRETSIKKEPESGSDKPEDNKWPHPSSILHSVLAPSHSPQHVHVNMSAHQRAEEANLAYRLQTINALANNLTNPNPTQNNTDHPQSKPKKQDAIMQTDPCSEEDDSQPNTSFSDHSDTSFHSDNIDTYPGSYQKDDYNGQVNRSNQMGSSQQRDSPNNMSVTSQYQKPEYDGHGNQTSHIGQQSESPNSNSLSGTPQYQKSDYDVNCSSHIGQNQRESPNSMSGGTQYQKPDYDGRSSHIGQSQQRESPTSMSGGTQYQKPEYEAQLNRSSQIGQSQPREGQTQLSHGQRENGPRQGQTGQTQENYEIPKDYTKSNDDFSMVNGLEGMSDVDKYAQQKKYEKSLSNYQQKMQYNKVQDMYPSDYNRDFQEKQTTPADYNGRPESYVGYQNAYADTVDILRNQQHNLQMLQQQHRVTENQNFFNESHIKQEIDLSNEEDKYLYEHGKDMENTMYSEQRRHLMLQQRMLDQLQPQVKTEPDPLGGCDQTIPLPASPYYQNGHDNIGAGYYEQFARQPGPELLIAKQNALAAHTQLWQNSMRRPLFYSENVHATGSQLLHRYEDLTRILQ